MKSNINSDQVKKLVFEAVEKALNECAYQHEANGEPYEGYDSNNLLPDDRPTPMGLIEPSEEMKKLSNTLPTQLKLSLQFYFGTETHSNKYGQLVSCPIIDLTGVKQ